MSKKFDVVIGNPPFGEEAQGAGTRETPLYHLFMDAAYEVSEQAVLITPARFLFNAGFTPKWWNEKMLSDPRLTVRQYVADATEVFPDTGFKGGVAVTHWVAGREGSPIEIFTSHPELNGILQKVLEVGGDSLDAVGITSSRSYRYTDNLYVDHPEARALRPKGNAALVNTNAFEQFSFLYREAKPDEGVEYVRVLGLMKNKRTFRWIRSDYLTGPASYGKFKVALAKANGSGKLGEVLSNPLVLEPNAAVTQSFITIGAFADEAAAEACLKYLKSKFARATLGILKVTQDNPAKVWKYVPAQDFTTASDIDWTKPIPEIDQQLYAKYGLDDDEIAFIEEKVKPMA